MNSDLILHMSGEVVLMMLPGPVAGAITAGSLHYGLGSWVTVSIGVVFVVCVIAFRRGLAGDLAWHLKRPL